jgi:hypothetical protein
VLKSSEQSPLSPEERELRKTRIQLARQVIAVVTVTGIILFFLYLTSGHVLGGPVHLPSLSRIEYDCLWLFGSLVLACVVLRDIRRGATRIGIIPVNPMFLYTRSSDPFGYWTLIALHGVSAVGIFIASFGDMLGFWNIMG